MSQFQAATENCEFMQGSKDSNKLKCDEPAVNVLDVIKRWNLHSNDLKYIFNIKTTSHPVTLSPA